MAHRLALPAILGKLLLLVARGRHFIGVISPSVVLFALLLERTRQSP